MTNPVVREQAGRTVGVTRQAPALGAKHSDATRLSAQTEPKLAHRPGVTDRAEPLDRVHDEPQPSASPGNHAAGLTPTQHSALSTQYSSQHARRRRPSLRLVLGIVAGGLALGVGAARLTAPLRPAPTPVVTSLPGLGAASMPAGPGPFAPAGTPPGGAPPGAGALQTGMPPNPGFGPFPGSLPGAGTVPPPGSPPAGAVPLPGGLPASGAPPVPGDPPGAPADSAAPLPPALAGGGGTAAASSFPGAPIGAPSTGLVGNPAPPAAAPAPALITSVDGDTLALMTATGPRRVRLQANTRVEKHVAANHGDLAPGQLIIVRGEPDGDEIVAGTIELLGGPLAPGGVAGAASTRGGPLAEGPAAP